MDVHLPARSSTGGACGADVFAASHLLTALNLYVLEVEVDREIREPFFGKQMPNQYSISDFLGVHS